ncbi:type IV pilus biogenesis protein PilM [Spiribacter roseus]|jgi:type IV pilus assembly protein PilM|uniref:type IV pilus biogenesis protein PilM n=1 Tax=Spiribacter roseus TaxID=1855875 RepID=UPI00132FA15A|nr:pilus assembly protein PilM [Spiribacter roseus]
MMPVRRRRRRGPAVIGIDCGTTAVKAVALRRAGGRMILAGHAIEPYPADDPSPASVAATIATAARRAAPDARLAATALADEQAITRVIKVPAGLDEAALETRVQLDIEATLKQSRQALAFDFRRLAAEPDGDQQAVLVVAARDRAIAERRHQLKAAGLRCQLIDLDAHASVRAALRDDRLPLGPTSAPVALLDIGARLRLGIFDRQRLHYCQTHELSDTPGDSDCLRRIEQALAMHHGSASTRVPDAMALIGGGASQTLAAAIASRLGSDCYLPDPLRGLELADAGDADAFAADQSRLVTAIGLALHAGDRYAHWR